jgi:hypothetical protein
MVFTNLCVVKSISIQPDMIELTVRGPVAALRFYRQLRLAVPEGVQAEAHCVDVHKQSPARKRHIP